MVGLVHEGFLGGDLQGVDPAPLPAEGDEDLPVAGILRELPADAPNEGAVNRGEPQQRRELIEGGGVGTLIQEDLHGGVTHDGILDDRRRDDIRHLLGDDRRAGVVLTRGLPQTPEVICRPFRRDGLPGLLDEHQLEGRAVGAHLALEGVDDAEGADGIEGRVHLRDGIHLEDDKARGEKIRGVMLIEDGAEPAGLPVGIERDAEGSDIQDRGCHLDPADHIGLHGVPLPEDPGTDLIPDKTQEILEDGIIPFGGKGLQEVRDDTEQDGIRRGIPAAPRGPDNLKKGDEEADTRKGVLRIGPAPAAAEGVERVGVLGAPGVVHPVPASGLFADEGREPLVGAALVYDEDVLSAVEAATHVPVREERLARSRGAQDEGVVVLDELGVVSSLLYVGSHRDMAVAVGDPERPAREIAHEGLADGKAEGLLQLCEEEVVFSDLHGSAGHPGKEELGHIDGVELPRQAQGRDGGSDRTPQGQLVLTLSPREDIHMGVDRCGGLGMDHVDEAGDPFGIDGVLGAALRHGGHVLAAAVQLPERVLLTGDEPVAADDMLEGEPCPEGGAR